MAEISKFDAADRSIGAILVDAQKIRLEDAERIIDLQRRTGLKFGEAGIKMGILSEADIMFALSRQFNYPYVQTATADATLSQELVTAYKPFSPEGLQIRAIRSQLQLRWLDEMGLKKSIAVVSPGAGEGRSYLAANLAISFAQLGDNVLLVDADFVRPRQHHLFGVGNSRGFSQVLAGKDLDSRIVPVNGFEGLHILPSGPQPPNPLELISGAKASEYFVSIQKDYNVIIFDTPSWVAGEESQMICRYVGGAIVTAKINHTKLSDINRVVADLNAAEIPVVGSVLFSAPSVLKKEKFLSWRK